MLVFCRGKPKDTLEECCSCLLILKLETDGDRVVGLEGMKRKDQLAKNEATYTFIKLDPLVYPAFLSKFWIEEKDTDLILRIIQEDNFSASFPQ